ncbi:MAG: phosphatidate cytidylyltransferase [Bacteroidales bacterium]|nr:phosphatidate cytidylyltransferase [Bacteroidales bacterium]
MNNLVQRTITGIIILLAVIGAITFGKISFFILFELIIIGAMYEFYTLAEKKKFNPLKVYGIVIGTTVFAANYFFVNDLINVQVFLAIIPIIISVFIIELYRKSEYVFLNIGFTLLGVLYIAIPFSFAIYIVFSDEINYNSHLLLGFFFLTWAFDTLAYVFGVSFGKHSLFERISPKKSWEGFIGGTISSIGMAYLISLLFPELPFIHWAIMSVMISVFGTYGDLVESSFKRNIEEKDSGNLLPGHGGILDRFDAVLFTLPIFYVYLQLIL